MVVKAVALAAAASLGLQDPGDAGDGQEEPGPDAGAVALVEEAPLPSVEEMAFPVLQGDFDGDGRGDEARARQGSSGVEISLELSSTGDVYVEALGAASLRQVEWEVVPPDAGAGACIDIVDCPASADPLGDGPRDAILVTLDGVDQFILRWDDGALETIFVDA